MEPEMVLIELIFQSTLPAWGATLLDVIGRSDTAISIHAPRMGSDFRRDYDILSSLNFNPRSPHGERRRIRF